MINEILKQSKEAPSDRFGYASEPFFLHIYAFFRLNHNCAYSTAHQRRTLTGFF
jgi:hypothetical protein